MGGMLGRGMLYRDDMRLCNDSMICIGGLNGVLRVANL